MATDAIRRGVSERVLQVYLGHADARSTRRYARLSDEALVSVLRPRATQKPVGALSVAEDSSQRRERVGDLSHAVAVPTGVEPVSPG